MMPTGPLSVAAAPSPIQTVDGTANTTALTGGVTWRRFARQSALWAMCMIGGIVSACLLYGIAAEAEANRAEQQTQTGYFADLTPRR